MNISHSTMWTYAFFFQYLFFSFKNWFSLFSFFICYCNYFLDIPLSQSFLNKWTHCVWLHKHHIKVFNDFDKVVLNISYKDNISHWSIWTCVTPFMTLWGCASPLSHNQMKLFFDTYTPKEGVHPSLLNFLCSLEYFNIYYLVNHKIITVIGKLCQKFAKCAQHHSLDP
jgi:hypothetical protein